MDANNKTCEGMMKQFLPLLFCSFVIAATNVIALNVAEAGEPAKATDRLTAPLDTIESTAPGSHTYQLAMSKDDKLCRRMLRIFNEDLAKYGYEQYAEHEEFKNIQWKEARFYSKSDGREDYRNAQGALVDINNDGAKEFVVKWEASLSGILRDSLYILDKDAANRADKLASRELFESKNMINSGWVHQLDPKYSADAEVFGILQPFIFNGRTYIFMRPLFELIPRNRLSFSVISVYSGGRFDYDDRSGKMDDICYFKRIRTNKQLPN